MRISSVQWDAWNEGHVAEHGLTLDEVDSVLLDPHSVVSFSRSSGRPVRSGKSSAGRLISVVFDVLDAREGYVYPITAFEIIRLPRRKKR